jgi:hypothetical protein
VAEKYRTEKTAWQELAEYEIKPANIQPNKSEPEQPENFDVNDEPYWS